MDWNPLWSWQRLQRKRTWWVLADVGRSDESRNRRGWKSGRIGMKEKKGKGEISWEELGRSSWVEIDFKKSSFLAEEGKKTWPWASLFIADCLAFSFFPLSIYQPFSMNLSAPFIPQFFKDQVSQVLQYSSLVFGNESEAEAYAESHSLGTKDLSSIAQHIADSPSKVSIPRKVIITNGSNPSILAIQGSKDKPTEHPTPKINPADIVDTNGAGDACAGGVLGALIAGKSIEEAIEVGHKLGGMCIGQVGPILKFRECPRREMKRRFQFFFLFSFDPFFFLAFADRLFSLSWWSLSLSLPLCSKGKGHVKGGNGVLFASSSCNLVDRWIDLSLPLLFLNKTRLPLFFL